MCKCAYYYKCVLGCVFCVRAFVLMFECVLVHSRVGTCSRMRNPYLAKEGTLGFLLRPGPLPAGETSPTPSESLGNHKRRQQAVCLGGCFLLLRPAAWHAHPKRIYTGVADESTNMAQPLKSLKRTIQTVSPIPVAKGNRWPKPPFCFRTVRQDSHYCYLPLHTFMTLLLCFCTSLSPSLQIRGLLRLA